MSNNLETLERRTRSVSGIRTIVHTMKTLSAINVSPCEIASNAITAYLDVVIMGLQGMHQNLSTTGHLTHPPITHRVILALGTDHGMCGNYNERLVDNVAKVITESQATPDPSKYHVVCIGAQLEKALKNRHIICQNALFAASGTEGLTRLATDLVAETDKLTSKLSNASVQVQMIYTQALKHGQQSVVVDTLLPLNQQARPASEHDQSLPFRPWYRQSEATLLAVLLRNYLYASICRAAADSLLTENKARLAHMRQAEDAVDEQLETLTQHTRSARQQRINAELQDVIAGFETVRSKQ